MSLVKKDVVSNYCARCVIIIDIFFQKIAPASADATDCDLPATLEPLDQCQDYPASPTDHPNYSSSSVPDWSSTLGDHISRCDDDQDTYEEFLYVAEQACYVENPDYPYGYDSGCLTYVIKTLQEDKVIQLKFNVFEVSIRKVLA